MHDDVQGFVKGALAAVPATAGGGRRAAALPFDLPAWPEVDFAKFGPVEPSTCRASRRSPAPNLHRNWVMIPHVTQYDEADITELEAFREVEQGRPRSRASSSRCSRS